MGFLAWLGKITLAVIFNVIIIIIVTLICHKYNLAYDDYAYPMGLLNGFVICLVVGLKTDD